MGAPPEPRAPARGAPGAVLFACSLNAVRSPMAEALARRLLPGSYVASAGLERGALDPFAVAAMREVGLDIGEHRPHTFDEVAADGFDLVVALSPEAAARATAIARTSAVLVEHWPTDDPTAATGTREQRLDAYRAVRDGLARRLRERFGGAPPGVKG